MPKSYKSKNGNYIDSSCIVHNKEKLSDLINNYSKLLWTNPNPDQAMTSGIIELSSGDYDILEIVFKPFYLDAYTSTEKILKGSNARLIYTTNSGTVFTRNLTYVDGTHYTVADASQSGNNSPLYVIGHKIGVFN